MKIKWPEKIKEYQGVSTFTAGARFGYNAAIEACQKAVEEAKGEGLVGESQLTTADVIMTHESTKWYRGDCCSGYPNCAHKPILSSMPKTQSPLLGNEFINILRKYWSFNDAQWHTHNWNDRENFIKDILPQFIAPKPRPVVTVEELKIVLVKRRYPQVKFDIDLIPYIISRECELDAKAIVNHLGQGE